eukprot:3567327-Rhodomonas_salina.2
MGRTRPPRSTGGKRIGRARRKRARRAIAAETDPTSTRTSPLAHRRDALVLALLVRSCAATSGVSDEEARACVLGLGFGIDAREKSAG